MGEYRIHDTTSAKAKNVEMNHFSRQNSLDFKMQTDARLSDMVPSDEDDVISDSDSLLNSPTSQSKFCDGDLRDSKDKLMSSESGKGKFSSLALSSSTSFSFIKTWTFLGLLQLFYLWPTIQFAYHHVLKTNIMKKNPCNHNVNLRNEQKKDLNSALFKTK